MMLFRPEGLIPSRQRKAELHAAATDPGAASRNKASTAGRGGLMAFFRLAGVGKTFGGLVAVNDLSFEIDEGTIVAMIGPNGAGKSTVFNFITGVYEPECGDDRVRRSVDRRGARRTRSRRCGIARTFQNIRLFSFMSALDNVMTGEHSLTARESRRLAAAHAAPAQGRSGGARASAGTAAPS